MRKSTLVTLALCMAMGMTVFAAEENYPKFKPAMTYKQARQLAVKPCRCTSPTRRQAWSDLRRNSRASRRYSCSLGRQRSPHL